VQGGKALGGLSKNILLPLAGEGVAKFMSVPGRAGLWKIVAENDLLLVNLVDAVRLAISRFKVAKVVGIRYFERRWNIDGVCTFDLDSVSQL